MTTQTASRQQVDARIRELHDQAKEMWPKLERIIDELKGLGPHSLDDNNALLNIREWLAQLSRR